jgi:hypothetical protein
VRSGQPEQLTVTHQLATKGVLWAAKADDVKCECARTSDTTFRLSQMLEGAGPDNRSGVQNARPGLLAPPRR